MNARPQATVPRRHTYTSVAVRYATYIANFLEPGGLAQARTRLARYTCMQKPEAQPGPHRAPETFKSWPVNLKADHVSIGARGIEVGWRSQYQQSPAEPRRDQHEVDCRCEYCKTHA